MKKGLLFLLIAFELLSCKKQTQILDIIALEELYPMKVGKVFIYKLDSTFTIDFGRDLATKSYHAKDTIESTFLDASGRTSFRIYRYTRDTLDTQDWAFAGTYYSTITNEKVEVNDNNLRFITLASPVSYNTTWKGNAFINTILGTSPYYFLDNWSYQYQNINSSFTCLKGNIDSTTTVLQQDYQVPESGYNAAQYSEKSYSIEVYAKGIGLVYKDFLRYVWQPTPQPAKFQDDSYGIRLNLIDYK